MLIIAYTDGSIYVGRKMKSETIWSESMRRMFHRYYTKEEHWHLEIDSGMPTHQHTRVLNLIIHNYLMSSVVGIDAITEACCKLSFSLSLSSVGQ